MCFFAAVLSFTTVLKEGLKGIIGLCFQVPAFCAALTLVVLSLAVLQETRARAEIALCVLTSVFT